MKTNCIYKLMFDKKFTELTIVLLLYHIITYFHITGENNLFVVLILISAIFLQASSKNNEITHFGFISTPRGRGQGMSSDDRIPPKLLSYNNGETECQVYHFFSTYLCAIMFYSVQPWHIIVNNIDINYYYPNRLLPNLMFHSGLLSFDIFNRAETAGVLLQALVHEALLSLNTNKQYQ